MIAEPIVQVIPLQTDEEGVTRVGGTRVTLDSLVYSFREGASAEEIVQQYPVLKLGDVYAVLGYYLKNRKTVDASIQETEEQAENFRHTHADHFVKNYREELLSRRSN